MVIKQCTRYDLGVMQSAGHQVLGRTGMPDRHILSLALLAGILSSCAAPVPSSPPIVPSASNGSASATETHTPSATPRQILAPFGDVTPKEGWVVVLSYDASSGEATRHALANPIRAEAPIQVLYACTGSGTIRLTAYVLAPPATGGPDINSTTDECSGKVRIFTTVAPDADTYIDLEITTSDPAARYWAVLTVPAGAVAPVF